MGKKKGIKWKYEWSRREYDACTGEEDKRSQCVWTAWPLQTKAVRSFQASISTNQATRRYNIGDLSSEDERRKIVLV
jgi:hypothetical protein